MDDVIKISQVEKAFLLWQIQEQIKQGNLEFAQQLRADLIEYLKENNLEYQWAEEQNDEHKT